MKETSRRQILKGVAAFAAGCAGLCTQKGIANSAEATTSLEYLVDPGRIRDFDPRVAGAVVAAFPSGQSPTNAYGEMILGCDLGVWQIRPKGDADETTLKMFFGDGRKRSPYKVKWVRARKEYKYKNEVRNVETEIPTLEPSELPRVISFAARNLVVADRYMLYLTNLGIFLWDDKTDAWHACAAESAELSEAADNAHYDSSYPRGPNNAVFIGARQKKLVFLLAAESGLHVMEVDPSTFRSQFMILAPFEGMSILTISSPRAEGDNTFNCECFTSGGVFDVRIDLTSYVTQRRSALFLDNQDRRIDLSDVIGSARHFVLSSDRAKLVAIGDKLGFFVRQRGGTFVANKISSFHEGVRDREFFRSANKACFLSTGELLVANAANVQVYSAEGDLLGSFAFPQSEAQSLISVFTPWDGHFAVGTSQGNVIWDSDSALVRGLRDKQSAIYLSEAQISTRHSPELIEQVMVPGPALTVGPGDYVVGSTDPSCKEDIQQNLQLLTDTLLVAIGIYTSPEGDPIALGALYDFCQRIMNQSGTSDQWDAQLAFEFYHYVGKASCGIIPSALLLPDDKLVQLVPRVVEGVISGDVTKESFSIAPLGSDAPCGWARFDALSDDQAIQLKTEAGQAFAKTIPVLFKNWSHNRSRTAKCDAIVIRNQSEGRRTIIL